MADAPNGPDWAAWITAAATLVLAVVAALQDRLRAFFFRPKLRVVLDPFPPDCHKTILIQRKELKPGVVEEASADCYYFRLRVKNDGWGRAELVEVFAKELWRKHFGSFERDSSFLPMNFKWSHTGEVFFPSIARGMEKHCDIGRIIDLAKRDLFEYEVLPGVPTNHTIFSLDLQVRPFTMTHLLPPGTYRLKLLVAAANAQPLPVTLEITHEQWDADERRMLAQPIVRLVDGKD